MGLNPWTFQSFYVHPTHLEPMVSQRSKASATPGASQHLASWLPRLYRSPSARMACNVGYDGSAALVVCLRLEARGTWTSSEHIDK